MLTLLRLLNVRHVRRQWIRAILSLSGIAVGVAGFIFGPALLIAIVQGVDLTRSSSSLSGRAEIEIRSSRDFLDPALLETVRTTPGVAVAAPFSQNAGFLMGQTEILVIVGIDPTRDPQVRDYPLAEGAFLSAPGDVLLSARYAAEKGIALGSTVKALSVGGLHEFTVRGLLDSQAGFGQLNSGDVLVVGLDDALKLRGIPALDTISIRLEAGAAQQPVIEALRARLPATALVEDPAAQFRGASEFNIVLYFVIGVVCGLLLILGALLILNAMAITVAQRRAEIGVLRALGAERRHVVALYLLEALLLGALGSTLGVPLGYGMVNLGQNLSVIPDFTHSVGLMARANLIVPDGLWLLAVLGGTLMSVLAGYFPARAASRTDPVEAMIQVRAETGQLRFSRRQAGLAVILILGVVIGTLAIPPGTLAGILFGNTAIFVVLGAMVLLVAPMMALLADRMPRWLYRWCGAVGLMAADNVLRRPKRMVLIAIFIMTGVAMGVQTAGTNFGYQTYIDEWSRAENVGDLIVMGITRDALRPSQPIPPGVLDEITAEAGLAGHYAERIVEHRQDGVTYLIRAVDMSAFRALGGYFPWGQGDADAAYAGLLDPTSGMALTQSGFLALANGVEPGKAVTLNTPSGPQALHIGGTILGTLETDRIALVVNRAWYVQMWGDSQVNRLTLRFAPGTDVQAVRRDLLRRYALRGVLVFDANEIRAQFGAMLITISTVSQMLSAALTGAFIAGVTGMFLIAVIDRRRELGLLRAVGMLRRQLVISIVLEPAILMVLGFVIAIPGVYLIHVLQRHSMEQLMGIRFVLDPREVLAMCGIGLVVALVSAYLPARAAGRTDILEAMRYE